MSPTGKPHPYCRRAVFVAALAPLALAGCGVADYEKKMQEVEVRTQRFDDENRLLGDPLELPPRLKTDGPPMAVFLRPPKGIAKTSVPEEIPYHYLATGGVCTAVYLAIGDGREKVENMIEVHLGVAGLNWQAVEVDPPGRSPLAFEAVEFFDPQQPGGVPAVYDAYVHQTAGLPAVGVVFRTLKANQDAAKPSMQMSLESYADGSAADKPRADFAKRTAR